MKQIGYYTLPNGQQLHFSINAWYILEEDTGLSPQKFLAELMEEGSKEEVNEFILLDLLTDLVFAACKAYDMEEGNDIDYTRYKIRALIVSMGGESLADLQSTLLNNSTVDYSLGKKKAQ